MYVSFPQHRSASKTPKIELELELELEIEIGIGIGIGIETAQAWISNGVINASTKTAFSPISAPGLNVILEIIFAILTLTKISGFRSGSNY